MNNKKSPAITIASIFVVALILGFFLIKTAPQNSPGPAPVNSGNANNMDSMHGEPSVSADNNQLNSLIGKSLPDVQLADKEGKVYTIESFKGKNTVLFFNEGLMCYPACWNQIASFGSDERFNSAQIQAISVVVDSAKDWQTAISQMPQLAKASTLFDTNANASRQLGLLATNSSMHRGSLPGHTYVIIDKNGIIRYVFDDPNMAIANDMLFGKIGELE
ncbi:MAG: redoxin domain-containing protein [bacterium]|nr:redoxin domain-containing protein [bacterium]